MSENMAKCPNCSNPYFSIAPIRKEGMEVINYKDDGWTQGARCNCGCSGKLSDFFPIARLQAERDTVAAENSVLTVVAKAQADRANNEERSKLLAEKERNDARQALSAANRVIANFLDSTEKHIRDLDGASIDAVASRLASYQHRANKAEEERGELLKALKALLAVMDKHGEWNEGCFYYHDRSASELQQPIEDAEAAIKKAGAQ